MKITDSGRLRKNEEIEEFALLSNPSLNKNRCEMCDHIKCMRSFHCFECNTCIIRYEMHSEWLGKCIGSKNDFLYIIFVSVFLLFQFFSLLLIFSKGLLFNPSPFLYIFSFSFIFYCFLKTIIFFKYYLKVIFLGVTIYESENYWRLPYLWKNFNKEFFNPFDKGKKTNFQEILYSFVNHDLEENPYQEVQESTLEENKYANQTIFFKGEYSRPYFKKNEEIINWTIYRIYSVIDIIQSPIRPYLLGILNNQ